MYYTVTDCTCGLNFGLVIWITHTHTLTHTVHFFAIFFNHKYLWQGLIKNGKYVYGPWDSIMSSINLVICDS
jgi:hypothetical protein